jgi:hypothetical protein
MPKEITPLSELQVKAIKPKVKADGTLDVDKTAVGGCPGLYLYTQPAGTKTWVLRAILNGKRVEFGLGSYATRASTQRKKASGKTETALTLKAARVKGMAKCIV